MKEKIMKEKVKKVTKEKSKKIMKKESKKVMKDQEVNRMYAGIIMLKDGWHKIYSNGNNNYTFEKIKE